MINNTNTAIISFVLCDSGLLPRGLILTSSVESLYEPLVWVYDAAAAARPAATITV